ncbi:hypothetical protein QTI66_00335 [Variovorax sp. J22R133]|uniref:hypothetical protein n=1 Tax=Variovorax brevis TaxID=3053503 RepID=UPI002577F307|nr:hypothetical protein [Variovorax sp. J22R133]MDM0110573.1 hypothetical protein [Variovorax sp. J22R133]
MACPVLPANAHRKDAPLGRFAFRALVSSSKYNDGGKRMAGTDSWLQVIAAGASAYAAFMSARTAQRHLRVAHKEIDVALLDRRVQLVDQLKATADKVIRYGHGVGPWDVEDFSSLVEQRPRFGYFFNQEIVDWLVEDYMGLVARIATTTVAYEDEDSEAERKELRDRIQEDIRELMAQMQFVFPEKVAPYLELWRADAPMPPLKQRVKRWWKKLRPLKRRS